MSDWIYYSFYEEHKHRPNVTPHSAELPRIMNNAQYYPTELDSIL